MVQDLETPHDGQELLKCRGAPLVCAQVGVHKLDEDSAYLKGLREGYNNPTVPPGCEFPCAYMLVALTRGWVTTCGVRCLSIVGGRGGW